MSILDRDSVLDIINKSQIHYVQFTNLFTIQDTATLNNTELGPLNSIGRSDCVYFCL